MEREEDDPMSEVLRDRFRLSTISIANAEVLQAAKRSGMEISEPVVACISDLAFKFIDYVMPKETVIVGDENGRFLYRSENESRNVCGTATSFSVDVALIFARDKENSCVETNRTFMSMMLASKLVITSISITQIPKLRTLSSCTNRSVSLKTLKIDENSKDCWNVGC